MRKEVLLPFDFCLNNPGRLSLDVVPTVETLEFDNVFFNSLVGVDAFGELVPLLIRISCNIFGGKSLNPGNCTALINW